MKINKESLSSSENNMSQNMDKVQEAIDRENEDTLARQAALEASQLRVPASTKS